MSTKVTRGQLLRFKSTPLDPDGNPVAPTSVKLYLNYVHSDGTTSTDSPLDMDFDTGGGIYVGEFNTAVAKPGPAYASVRAVNPAGGEDIKFQIVANAANPDP